MDRQNFAGKYEKSGKVCGKLINNFFNSIKELVQDLDVQNILEVGCGPGFSTQKLKQMLNRKHFEASDVDSELVEGAKNRNPNVKIIQESIYNLKRQNNSFDLVIALEVLEHLQEPEKALREIQRISTKYILVSVPNEPIWRILNMARLKYLKNFGNTPGHLQNFSKSDFKNFVSKHFRIVRTKTPLPWTIILAEK